MTDEYEQRILDDIARYGWHTLCIERDDGGPGFDYTIGFMETFNHPEIIIFGLDKKLMHRILYVIAKNIQNGKSYKEPGACDDILEDFPCFFLPVHISRQSEYLGFAMWHRRYVGKIGTLEVMQCFWPDKSGKFPWELGCNTEVQNLQPLLNKSK